MAKLNRRNFLKATGAAGAASTLPFGLSAFAGAGKGAKVVVVGGGFGGATAAKYVKMFDPSIDVTLVEAHDKYVTCPASNWVLAGLRDIGSITHTYDGLKKRGINVVHDRVTAVDAGKKTISLHGGSSLNYDRLIMSPGIEMRWDAIEGYDQDAALDAPHAWKAGPETTHLRTQLEAMPDGGTFVIVPPPNPFRCPPGPAERISMVAHYFKEHKPKSKIIAIDSKPKFSKQGLFVQGWEKLYGFKTDNSMIDYHHQAEVESVDVKNKTVVAGVEDIKADVLNVIPPQKAGNIAQVAGLADDSGWCPVNHLTWESTLHENIHVIGDASIAAKGMPKSGYMANSEAKVCAAAVVDMLHGKDPGTPSWVNTCYSLVAPGYGISVAAVYGLNKDGVAGKVEGSGGLTPMEGANHQLEAVYAESWYNNIVDDLFG
ncbi:MAG: FCSD flavin-binding domain-containing protein [Pseudomonadota bacterium]